MTYGAGWRSCVTRQVSRVSFQPLGLGWLVLHVYVLCVAVFLFYIIIAPGTIEPSAERLATAGRGNIMDLNPLVIRAVEPGSHWTRPLRS